MVGGVEADRAERAGGADVLAPVACPQGVAAVFNQQEIVLAAELGHRVEIEGIAEGVGDNHRPGARPLGLL